MIKIKLHWMGNDSGDNPLQCHLDGPDPPNPIATAAAQTGTNVSTAVANAWLGNVNQVTPTGNLNFGQTGTHAFTDPTTGQTYQIPSFTMTQSLTPDQQQIQDLGEQAEINLAGLASDQSGFLKNYMATPFSLNGAPAGGSASWLNTPGAATDFGDAGAITRDYGDFAGERNRIEDSLMQRLNPQLGQERSRYEQQLADQGIRYGSSAYTNAMDNYNRMATDARLGVIGQAGQEQERMSNIAAQRAQFQNTAQQQMYDQLLGRGQFYNAGALQRLNQNQSLFNAANVERQQRINEMKLLRDQPINEITALLSQSQVSNPNFVNANMPTIPTTDVAGMINQNYQQRSQNWNSMMGGILGAVSNVAGAAWLKSDRNVKENIEPLGTVFAERSDGEERKLPIYRYSYKDDPSETRHVGPMAQDVAKIAPRAVKKIGGVRHINVPRLGSILKAA